ncbi:MAG: zinc-binding dehydrogenase [Firmicutes bacterium]|nr:zinc-binding dehydrogenase [Bacillota bacterium]
MESVRAKRVVFSGPAQVRLEEVDLPGPGPGQARVRGERSLISTGTEMTAYSGDFPPGDSAWARYVRYPFPPGYSLVGTVEAVGEGCALVPGQRVAVEAPHASFVLVDAPAAEGGGAESIHSPSGPVAVPDRVSPDEAAFHSLARIAMQGVRLAQVELGASVAVIGCGLVGQLAMRLARLAGALRVVAVDVSERRLERALAGGADGGVRADVADPAQAVRARCDGRLADVVIDATGAPSSFATAVRIVRDLGRVVLLGSPRGAVTIDLHDDVHTRGLVVVGAHASTTPRRETAQAPWSMARNTALFFALVADGRLRVDDLVSHRFPLARAEEAYGLLAREREAAMGVLFDLGG